MTKRNFYRISISKYFFKSGEPFTNPDLTRGSSLARPMREKANFVYKKRRATLKTVLIRFGALLLVITAISTDSFSSISLI